MAYIGEQGAKQLAILINNRYITAEAVDEKITNSGFSTYDPDNKETLGKLSTSTEGNLLFDGKEIKGGTDGNIPTKTSELTNDSGFITSADIPTNVSAFTNDSGYLTEHQSLDGYAKTDDLYDPDNKDTLAKLSTSDDGTLLFDGEEIKGGGDTVEVTQTLTSGTEIGSIKVGDETTVLYAPEGGSGSGAGDVYYAYEGYSEEETCIGEYFGKPLYRKTFKFNNSSQISYAQNTWYETEFTLSGTSHVIYGYVTAQGSQVAYPCSIHIVSGKIGILSYRTTNYITVGSNLIVEYTKSTDAENSFTPSMVTANKTIISAAPYFEDYSTDEKVIGRWIDGKPIYSVTKKISQLPNTTYIEYSEFDNELNVADAIISASGYCVSSNYSNNLNKFNIPLINAANTASGIGVHIHNNHLTISTGSNRSDYYAYITLEYTKTTDAPNSFKPEMITSGIMADEPASDAEVDEIFN